MTHHQCDQMLEFRLAEIISYVAQEIFSIVAGKVKKQLRLYLIKFMTNNSKKRPIWSHLLLLKRVFHFILRFGKQIVKENLTVLEKYDSLGSQQKYYSKSDLNTLMSIHLIRLIRSKAQSRTVQIQFMSEQRLKWLTKA